MHRSIRTRSSILLSFEEIYSFQEKCNKIDNPIEKEKNCILTPNSSLEGGTHTHTHTKIHYILRRVYNSEILFSIFFPLSGRPLQNVPTFLLLNKLDKLCRRSRATGGWVVDSFVVLHSIYCLFCYPGILFALFTVCLGVCDEGSNISIKKKRKTTT